MRRLLATALLATPLLAAAQTEGSITVTPDTVVNRGQCLGTETSADLLLAWRIKPEGVTFTTAGEYRVFASAADPGSASPYCNVTRTGGASTEVATTPTSLSAPLTTGSATVKRVDVAAAAGFDCTADATIHLCVLWYADPGDLDGSPKGWAKGQLDLKVAGPGKPGAPTVISDEEALQVRTTTTPAGTGGVAAVRWRAVAEAVTADKALDAGIHSSSRVAVGSSVRIAGLVNGCRYEVKAITYSAEGNESVPSDPSAPVAPQAVDDAWEHYKAALGRDDGGCQAGGAGLGALLAVLALARLRRRP